MTAVSGEEALEILKRVRPDVILLDICMPEMNGFELARRLKADPDYRDIPILATTGLAEAAERKRCIEAGCCDSLVKPFGIQELQNCSNRLLPKMNSDGRALGADDLASGMAAANSLKFPIAIIFLILQSL